MSGRIDEEAAAAYRSASEAAAKRGMRIAHNGGMAFPIGADGKRVFHFSFEPARKRKAEKPDPPTNRRGVHQEQLL